MSLKPPSEKQSHFIWIALTSLAALAIAVVVVAFFWGIGQTLNLLGPLLWPLGAAGILAYLLDPIVGWLEKKRKIPPFPANLESISLLKGPGSRSYKKEVKKNVSNIL